jgi:hypothetical protein
MDNKLLNVSEIFETRDYRKANEYIGLATLTQKLTIVQGQRLSFNG